MRKIKKYIKDGVIFLNSKTCYCDNSLNLKNCTIGLNCKIINKTEILNNTGIENSTIENCTIGKDCYIFGSLLKNCIIEDNTIILSSVLQNSIVKSNVTVGPFAYLREQSIVENNCRVGDFVELKNSHLSSNVKCAHLCYIGDAEIGERCNMGCGTVFANYDGKQKHKTRIGKDTFIGANVNLVAPLTIGNNCFVGAGMTLIKH